MAAEPQDMTGDGGVLKEVLTEGTGEDTPQSGDEVEVHYTGTLASDGSQFDSSRDRGDTFKFKLGQGQVIKGWDEGVATMRLGERAMLTLSSEYAYGDSGSPPKIPGGATLKFDVELIGWKDGSWDDVHGTDSAVRVKLTSPGESYETPAQGDELFVSFRGTADGAVVQEQAEIGPLLLGKGALPCGVEKAICNSFKKGSAGTIKVAAGNWCQHDDVPDGPAVHQSEGPLEYEISLERWHTVVDVHKDGELVVKCTTDSDSYQKPSDGASCTFELEGQYADDGSEWQAKQQMTISIGEDSQLPCVEQALCEIKQGQRAEVAVGAKYGPDGRPVNMVLNVVDVTSSYSLSIEEKLAAAAKRKELGNGLVKQGEWQKALDKYDAGFKMVEYSSEEEDKKDEVQALKLSFHLNRSLAWQKLGEHTKCIQECTKVLELDSANTKAMYRQACSQIELGELKAAKEVLLRLKELDPSLKLVDQQLARLEKRQKQLDKQDKQLFAKMMSGVGKGKDAQPVSDFVKEPEASTEDEPMVPVDEQLAPVEPAAE